MTRLVVSLHDVAPATAETSRRWLELLESRGIRCSLLVVPGPWQGPDFAASGSFLSWLRRSAANGHEVVLHGWAHRREEPVRGLRGRAGSLLGRGCEEFWNISYTTAADKIARGREVLNGEGFDPVGFVAPGWLMSAGTMHALRATTLRYTLTHTRMIDLASGHAIRAVTTSQRPNDRLGRVVATGTIGLASAILTGSRPLRIAVHPDDLGETRLRNANMRLIDIALGHGYSAMPYRDFHHLQFGEKVAS